MDGGRWCGDIKFQWKRSLINTLYNSPTPKSSIGITSKWFAPLLFTTRKGLLEMYTWQKKTKNHMFLLHNSNILIWKFHEILLYLNVSFCSFLRQPAVVILIWSPSLTIWQLDFKKLKQTLDLCILYTRNNLKIWTTLCQVFFYKCKYCMMIFLTINYKTIFVEVRTTLIWCNQQ